MNTELFFQIDRNISGKNIATEPMHDNNKVYKTMEGVTVIHFFYFLEKNRLKFKANSLLKISLQFYLHFYSG